MCIERALSYARSKPIVGFLFSASYCKWCHTFVPMLASMYPYLKEYGIEIVLVGSDKTEEAFNAYSQDHSWPVIDYNDEIRAKLREEYNIKTIPALLFVDKECNIVNPDGRNLVASEMSNVVDPCLAAKAVVRSLQLDIDDYDSDASDF